MGKLIRDRRDSAQVTRKFDDGLVTEKEGHLYTIRSLTLFMTRKRGGFQVDSIQASAAHAAKNGGFRKAYYNLTDFDITPEIQQNIDEMVELVRQDNN